MISVYFALFVIVNKFIPIVVSSCAQLLPQVFFVTNLYHKSATLRTKTLTYQYFPLFSPFLLFSPIGHALRTCLASQEVSNLDCTDFFFSLRGRHSRGKQKKPLGFVIHLIPLIPPKKSNICWFVETGQGVFYPHSVQSFSKRGDVNIPHKVQTQPQLTPAK